jgi:hypothetical protein
MVTPGDHSGRAGAALSRAARALGVQFRVIAKPRWFLGLLIAILLVVALGAFALGRLTTSASFDIHGPPHIAIPAHATLLRREVYLDEQINSWYYAVPGASHDSLTAFYRDTLASGGWECFKAETSTNFVISGKPYSGTSVYVTALRGSEKALIYLADQEYGSYLLQDDLPDDSIGLKISLETAKDTTCVP